MLEAGFPISEQTISKPKDLCPLCPKVFIATCELHRFNKVLYSYIAFHVLFKHCLCQNGVVEI